MWLDITGSTAFEITVFCGGILSPIGAILLTVVSSRVIGLPSNDLCFFVNFLTIESETFLNKISSFGLEGGI